MECGFRAAYDADHSGDGADDIYGNCSAPYGSTQGATAEIPVERDVDADPSRCDHLQDSRELPEGPITSLSDDLWRLIVTYLVTSDMMSLRCTAQLVQRPLKVITDAILDGCWMIDGVTQGDNLQSEAALAVIDVLRTLRLEARCDMIKRYARQVGRARSHVTALGDQSDADARTMLYSHYFSKPTLEFGSLLARSAAHWRRTVDTTKTAILNSTFSASHSISLADLYAADMYAPLLGLVSDPRAHVRCVMDEAAVTLSTGRWMDFLHAVATLKDIHEPIASALQVLAVAVDHCFPMPRAEVLSTILVEAMMIPHRHSVREVCLNRIGLTPEYVTKEIAPRIAEWVTGWLFSDPSIRAADLAWRLEMLAARWGDDDGSFAACLHHSFLTLLAKNTYCASTPWEQLPEAVRTALRTRVLGIAPADSVEYGLEGTTILDFWGLYYKVSYPRPLALAQRIESMIDAQPWPLQATLCRVAADTHADPLRALISYPVHACPVLSAERLDALCIHALDAGKPRLALSALHALLRWQVTRACESIWDDPLGDRPPAMPRNSASADRRVRFSPVAWAIFERCTLAERLPFVAALFGYRDVLKHCGYSWQYEAIVADDVVAFLCDPTSRLIRPSSEVVHVLLHYLPICGERLPEFVRDPVNWEIALTKRLDLTSAEGTHPIVQDRTSRS